MQYLSQRLASKPSPGRGGDPPPGALPPPQRERILDATERLIADHGCTGASIEAIVKAAGVSSVTFYEFFEGKEECFVAAFDRAVEGGAAELARVTEAEELSWPEQIATGLRAVTALIGAEPERARLCLGEAQTGGPELSAHFEAAPHPLPAKLPEGPPPQTPPSDLPPTPEEATPGALPW